jgi:hypothetical protein
MKLTPLSSELAIQYDQMLKNNPDLIAYVEQLAEEDADSIIQYYTKSNLRLIFDSRSDLPVEAFKDLSAIFRLQKWEQSQLNLPFSSDLPSANELLMGFVLTLEASTTQPLRPEQFGGLARKVLRLAIKHFVWAAPIELNAEISLDASANEDDQFINQIADLLWNNRHMSNKEEHHAG